MLTPTPLAHSSADLQNSGRGWLRVRKILALQQKSPTQLSRAFLLRMRESTRSRNQACRRHQARLQARPSYLLACPQSLLRS
jgi:hypothetical protein